MGVYTTLEGHINYRGRLPRDRLGIPIIYQGVQFLSCEGLLHLNRYMAATFLDGAYDENCFTLEIDAAILREALSDFQGCAIAETSWQSPLRAQSSGLRQEKMVNSGCCRTA